MKFLILSLTITYSSAFAEYRVYQYQTNTNNNLKTILSTLNPVSFESYHGGSNLTEISLLRTWMCPGYTGLGKELCPSPYSKIMMEEKQ